MGGRIARSPHSIPFFSVGPTFLPGVPSGGRAARGRPFAYFFRAARKVTPRLSGYGQYDYARDWRIGHVAALTTRVHSILSLKVSHTTRYVNFPPPGFEKTDTITSVALVAKF